MRKITPFLWFDNQAEEAANFYVSLFPHSKITNVGRYSKEAAQASGRPENSVMIVNFELGGEPFIALNGGPIFKFSGAISFVINCETQEEVDYYWEKLSAGGEAGQCGWINHDTFGVTWQVVPEALGRLMSDPDQKKAQNVMKAMLEMTKIDIQGLQKAYDEA